MDDLKISKIDRFRFDFLKSRFRVPIQIFTLRLTTL